MWNKIIKIKANYMQSSKSITYPEITVGKAKSIHTCKGHFFSGYFSLTI